MKNLRHIFSLLSLSVLLTALLHSCIEDGMTTSPSDQPAFSTDTVRMGTLFTLDASPTHRFTIYNRHDKGINISSIAFKDNPDNIFRMNVDGMTGNRFSNVEIRAKDSISYSWKQPCRRTAATFRSMSWPTSKCSPTV